MPIGDILRVKIMKFCGGIRMRWDVGTILGRLRRKSLLCCRLLSNVRKEVADDEENIIFSALWLPLCLFIDGMCPVCYDKNRKGEICMEPLSSLWLALMVIFQHGGNSIIHYRISWFNGL